MHPVKITVYTDGRTILGRPIELEVTDKEKRTAARTIWEKKHADYITFAFDFALT
jgi:hypothetical protein